MGLSSPDGTHESTCRTSATGRFFCKRCKNPRGYHPTKLRREVRERTKRPSVNASVDILGTCTCFGTARSAPACPTRTQEKHRQHKPRLPTRPRVPAQGRTSNFQADFTGKLCRHQATVNSTGNGMSHVWVEPDPVRECKTLKLVYQSALKTSTQTVLITYHFWRKFRRTGNNSRQEMESFARRKKYSEISNGQR